MNDFIEMSKYAGMREDLVQAGGGNSAFKMRSDRMLVKASGCRLADISKDSGFAVVNPAVIREAFLNIKDLDHMTETESGQIVERAFIEGGRPSIETFLHAVSDKYSLHTHPFVVNILASRKGGMEILKKMFPDSWIIPYATPGIGLAKAYFKQCRQCRQDAAVVFLQNHGLLVSASTAEQVITQTEEIVTKIENYLDMDLSADHAVTTLYRAIGGGIIWRVTDEKIKDARKKAGRIWNHAFCPDCVVFLGKKMFDAGDYLDAEQLEAFRAESGEPVVIAYRQELYIHAPSVKKALEIQSILSFSAQVLCGNAGYECHMLSDDEQDFLLGWDAEKYRKNISEI